MKGLVIVGDKFEDVELLAPVDILKRNGDEIIIASVMGRKLLQSARGIEMHADELFENVRLEEYDFLFIPGGAGAFEILKLKKEVETAITYFANNRKYICTICAAPMLVGCLNLLNKKNYTVFPGFEDEVIGGIYLKDHGVVVDDIFITGKSMYYALEFGLTIVEALYDKERKEKLLRSLKGE